MSQHPSNLGADRYGTVDQYVAATTEPGTIHDGFCRCRACKPPLVGEQASRDGRALVGMVYGAPVALTLWAIAYAIVALR